MMKAVTPTINAARDAPINAAEGLKTNFCFIAEEARRKNNRVSQSFPNVIATPANQRP